MGHAIMHNNKREPQNIPGTLPASIGAPFTGGATGSLTGFASETRPILSTYVETVTFSETTRTNTVLITNSADLSSIRASESSKTRTAESSTQSSATAAATPKAANDSSSSSNNLSTLIPAIVVPVAVLLIASFAIFWFMMRRRHKRQLKEEPQFVMASKTEKSPISRGNSNSSGHSSTRELVPMSKLEKETGVTTSEVTRSSLDLFPPKYTSTDIGVARPMTPPDRKGSEDISNEKPYRNFSSVRPNDRNRPGTGTSAKNAPTSRSNMSPRHASRYSPSKSNRGPSPQMRGLSGHPQRPPRSEDIAKGLGSASPPRTGLGAIPTQMARSNRAAPPTALDPPTPTGAFNGASPISQYSPIAKGHPNITSRTAPQSPTGPIVRSNAPVANRGTDSPIDDNVLSHENMRIARLANSSRLGFNPSPVEPNFPSAIKKSLTPSSKPQTNLHTTATSPQLPPPLTKEDLPSRPFARVPDSPAAGSSIYPSPSIGAGATPRIGGGYSTTSLPQSEHTIGMASSTNHTRHFSAISRLSSDDGYVDMEFDAKSDVSSLDDRDKWEMDQGRNDAESQLGSGHHGSGYGSAGMSPVDGPAGPSSASTGVAKPNLRDRDSEGPFVLSRY